MVGDDLHSYQALVEKIRKETACDLHDSRERLDQNIQNLAKEEDLVFLCGLGVDERVLEMIATDYLSAGSLCLAGSFRQ